MSSTSFQASADLASASNEPECEPSRFAKSTNNAARSSTSTGLTSPATMTCEPSPPTAWQQTELPWMSSVEASPAKTSASLEKARELKGRAAAYGRSTPDLLASYDPNSSSWKTSQSCLVTGWESFSGTWPRSGTMRNGRAYQLLPLAPPRSEIASGLLPTPTSGSSRTGAHHPFDGGSRSRSKARELGLLPTVTLCGNHNRVGASPTSGDGLFTVLKAANDGEKIGATALCRFVEWLMGFPEDWTRPRVSAMPSSPKSWKSSGGRS